MIDHHRSNYARPIDLHEDWSGTACHAAIEFDNLSLGRGTCCEAVKQLILILDGLAASADPERYLFYTSWPSALKTVDSVWTRFWGFTRVIPQDDHEVGAAIKSAIASTVAFSRHIDRAICLELTPEEYANCRSLCLELSRAMSAIEPPPYHFRH